MPVSATTIPLPSAVCWIKRFSQWSEPILVPRIWKEWAAVAALSATMERRIWTRTPIGPIYPSMFIFLVGPPGSGKSLTTGLTERLLRAVGEINISPESMTKASLVDNLKLGLKTLQDEDGSLDIYHTLAAVVPEFDVFMPAYDQSFLSHCARFWDCDSKPFRESTRTHGDVQIDNAHMTLLAGIQPGVMNRTFPETAWTQGFMARVICCYQPEIPRESLFKRAALDPTLEQELVLMLQAIHERSGELKFSREALESIDLWWLSHCPPEPIHPRLVHYNTRRPFHLMKLALVFAVARSHMSILLTDVEAAKDLLLRTEEDLTDMIHSVVTSDQAHAEIYHAAHEAVMKWALLRKEPMPESALRRVLMQVTSQPQLVDAFIINLVKSNILRQEPGPQEPLYIAGVYKEKV